MYLSIVITSRNDDYGGNALKRFEYFFKSLDHCLNKYNLYSECELVLVEWNPPPDKKDLESITNELIAKHSSSLVVKVIKVSPEHHESLNAPFPLCEFHGKNVGIAHSSGENVLITNPDIIFQESLFEWIALKNISGDKFYRAMRVDIKNQAIYNDYDYNELIDFCSRHALWHSQPPSPLSLSYEGEADFNKKIKNINAILQRHDQAIAHLFTNASGDFILTSKENLLKVKGYFESLTLFTGIDSILVYQLHLSGLAQVILDYNNSVFHIDHSRISLERRGQAQANKIFDTLKQRFSETSRGPVKRFMNSNQFPT